MKRLEENLKTYRHIQIFYIQKIEGDIGQETRVIEVKAEEKFKNPNIIYCYCGKKGHFKSFCKQLKQDLKEGKREENNENNVVHVVQDDLLFACDKDVINFVSQDTSWIVDS